jgi:hypothetical protein
MHDLDLSEGRVPEAVEDPVRVTRHWQMARDAFRMTLPSGLAFHYRRGRGSLFSRPATVSDEEVALFFNGSVRGAIAWLNGFVPLHASAIVVDDGIYAFTGASGEGKSTLAAALAGAGFTIFCDDLLIVTPVANEAPRALAGGGRLKLWQDALTLTGSTPSAAVRPGLDKFFVGERPVASGSALPLRRLYRLETLGAPDPVIAPIDGSARIAAMRDAYYRPEFGAALPDRATYFRAMLQLADAISLRRFARPRDRTRFADGIAAMIGDLHSPPRRSASAR